MSVLETIVLSYPDGDPGTGDGVVTTISFAVSDVFFVRTVVTNPNNSTPGFGIDNIQFTDAQFATVPEPCGLVVWAVLGAAIIPWWRRRMPRPG